MSILANTRLVCAVAVFGALATVAACKKTEPATDTTSSAGAVVTPPTVTVADVDIGKKIGPDKKIIDKTDDFSPTDSIYASVHTTGSSPSTSLTARWTFENGTVVDERSETITPSGDTYTEFHIVKPGGWPKGKYTLHVLLDGREVQTKEVTVK
jgi:hypothetical protein